MRLNRGQLYIISAPSGTGKTTLSRRLLKGLSHIRESVSYTTRSPRPGEVDKVDYIFVSVETFRDMLKNNAFIEYAEVHGNLYGTALATIQEVLSEGNDVLLDIDTQGARQIRNKHIKSTSIFIIPPSMDALYQRLKKRNTETDEIIRRRMEKANDEIREGMLYDYIIVNDNLDQAFKELSSVIMANRVRANCIDRNWVKETFHI
ncbi:MAG: guanylate kinase [Candidatus Magnetobacterium sp. LHC-1]|uniref:Guanylate kinase n=1 Tax=Candidatus Magnetobacterium casense TaxID=1455061 RepID=A0ABS6RXP2_9BACT|nr:guanylate kinase [Candidatus Magnetobacterium casensis]MBF0608393.1 guanylate kinase [Nitrospirota bacterium]MBV6341404.1 guanylate kinase [Candidatus Magnetobacterium casensis]